MSKAVRLSVSTPTISDKSGRQSVRSSWVLPITSGTSDAENDARKFEAAKLIPIALFSGIGLVILLVAMLFGVEGGWY